jgi:hypothetical protein
MKDRVQTHFSMNKLLLVALLLSLLGASQAVLGSFVYADNEFALDSTVSASGPALPSGYPFLDIRSSWYRSATTFSGFDGSEWVVQFFDGNDGIFVKSNFTQVWCVRGGQGVNPQCMGHLSNSVIFALGGSGFSP